MNATAFDSARIVRPALRTLILYIPLIMITLMTMLKPAYASGTVASVAAGGVLYADPGHTRPVNGYGSDGTATTFYHHYYFLHDPTPGDYYDYCVTGFYADISSRVTGWTGSIVGGNCQYYSWSNASTQFPNDWAGTFQTCPAHSTGTTTCTCNDQYQPDPPEQAVLLLPPVLPTCPARLASASPDTSPTPTEQAVL